MKNSPLKITSNGKRDFNYFLQPKPSPWKHRIGVIFLSLLVFLTGQWLVNPAVGSYFKKFLHTIDSGPRILFQHILIYSLPKMLLCLILFLYFVKAGLFYQFSLKRKLKISLIQGIPAGLAIAAIPMAIYIFSGKTLSFHPDLWEIGGNLFSNAWEEIIFRGFLFTAALYFTRIPWAAAIFSGLIFGFTHTQYFPLQQIYVGVIGIYFALLYFYTGNLIAPWIAHQVSDMILDSIISI